MRSLEVELLVNEISPRTAARLDLLRDIGPRAALRQWRDNRRHARQQRRKAVAVAEEMWREAARATGADFRIVGDATYEFRLGSARAFVNSQTTPFADPVSQRLADDKPLAYDILSDAGLPVPTRIVVSSEARTAGVRFAAEVGGPVLVKPARGSGGAGVIGHIYTTEQLTRALLHAGRVSPEVVIEKQVEGDSYRILTLDGDAIGVLRRQKPTITGDGRSTVSDLIFCDYESRIAAEGPAALKALTIDLDCIFTLAHVGLRLDSVVPAGDSVIFKTASNYNGPDQTHALEAPYPPALVQPARQAANALGARLAGVDIVTSDAALPLEETRGVVLEVNARPALSHHYNVAELERTSVAVPIVRALLGLDDGADRT